MQNYYLQTGIALLIALSVGWLLIPGIIRLSLRWRVVDQPNERKVHRIPVPRLGGVGIFLSALAGLLLSTMGVRALADWPVFFSSLGLLFMLGVWDDLRDISARLRLLIQLGCAFALAASGIRLTSLYGVFGIYTLSVTGQYAVTIMIVAGTTNAFNLIDGVDGLAGGLALMGLTVLAGLSFMLQQYSLLVILAAFAGGVSAFLRYNRSPAKIFMGDGGSLVLGYLMSASGIILIEKARIEPALIAPHRVALLVTAILVIPVFDTLRVFATRIRKGRSPFKADKIHIHHLLLVAGMDHRKTSLFLYLYQLLLILLSLFLPGLAGVSLIMLAMVALFHLLTTILRLNQAVEHWLSVVRRIERES